MGAVTLNRAQGDAVVGPRDYPAAVNPLTGLPVDDPELLARRPVLVKVSNYPPVVRPQSGLMQADIVWETLLSGGVTRFSAVYLSQDAPRVGPIRSGRLVDFELTRIYRSLFVYSGMAQGEIDILRGDGLVSSRAVSGIEPCPALCRDPQPGLALEHTLYGDVAALRELAVERRRDTEPEAIYGMAFAEAAPAGGVPVESATIKYVETAVDWHYDADAGRWLRVQDDEPHFDAVAEAQISAANVVIIEEEHTIQPFVSANYWGPGDFAFSVNFIGEGRVFLLRDGRYYEGVWRRATRDEPLTFFDAGGEPLPFRPGNTFFTLVPEWIDGYQLAFGLADAPQVSVNGTTGVSMRRGPGEAYVSPDVAYPGDVFDAVGRNRSGDWLQVRRGSDPVVWLPLERIDLDATVLASLPITRPINER
jgi:hypothetical protein